MSRPSLLLPFCLLLVLAPLTPAADPPALVIAQGKVEKVEKESLTIQPRDASGKFGKAIVLKLTGTSKVSTVSTRETAAKVVLVQRDTDVADLKQGQIVAVIYTTMKDGNVLLSAVVQPSDK
jgi:hypothetical protein